MRAQCSATLHHKAYTWKKGLAKVIKIVPFWVGEGNKIEYHMNAFEGNEGKMMRQMVFGVDKYSKNR